jgi:DNA-binding transcriptional regulator YhcF (GntR family)
LQQLINELVRIIHAELNEGDLLPSVNEISKHLSISRDTVFKAYSKLKKRGLVDASPNKGYYVSREVKKVLMLLDYYSPHKETLFRQVQKNLDASYSVDLLFHHYNQRLFDSIILENIGRYNYYIVMNFDTQNFRMADCIKKLDPAKLLLLDIPVHDWNEADPQKYNYIWQDFEQPVYQLLTGLYERITGYRLFHLVNPVHLQHPTGTVTAFNRFCKDYGVKGNVISSKPELKVKKHEAFFVLRQPDLQVLLEECRDNSLKAGADVGILMYNDSPLYEFVSCGITVISADFTLMGQKVSQFILNGTPIQEIIPTKNIIRQSL